MTLTETITFFGSEFIALLTLVAILVGSLFVPDRHKRLFTSVIAFGGVSIAIYDFFGLARDFPNRELFSGLVAADPLALLFKAIFLLATFLVVFMVYDSDDIPDRRVPEFYVFLFTIFIGMSLLASGLHLVILYMALETVSLPSYVMAGYDRRNRNSAEASVKYMLYGAVSGALFLFGASLLYGVTGAFRIPEIATALSGGTPGFSALIALLFMLIGIGYKCSFFPMHMWVPDVYQGAPTAVAGFLSTAPKAAGFAVLLRLSMAFVPALESATFAAAIPLFFFLISAVTMTIGNLSALFQDNVKRLLGYSTVAHVGYILMGYTLIGSTHDAMVQGFSAIGFYLIVYTVMNLGAFLVVLALDREWLDQYNGLFERAPMTAVAMGVFLFSLTGIPPMAGFYGKFYLFMALINAGSTLFYTLAVLGVLNSVVSFFYYARILKRMFLTDPDEETTGPIAIPPVSRVLVGAMAVFVVGITLFLGPLLTFTRNYLVVLG